MSLYVFTFTAQAMYFSEYQHVHEHKCAIIQHICFYTTVQSNTVFRICFRTSEPVIQRSIQMDTHVSFLIESAVLNGSCDLNDSINNLLKQGLTATYCRFYCHLYLSMAGLTSQSASIKTHSAKYTLIINIDQHFSISGLRRKKVYK